MGRRTYLSRTNEIADGFPRRRSHCRMLSAASRSNPLRETTLRVVHDDTLLTEMGLIVVGKSRILRGIRMATIAVQGIKRVYSNGFEAPISVAGEIRVDFGVFVVERVRSQFLHFVDLR